MKINEKNLISFATSNTTSDRVGWLSKRGEVNKSLQKRWFVLKGNLLFYFERVDDKEPMGVIILEGCTIELAENEEAYAFKLVFHGSGNRTYIFAASNQEDMEGWMKAISSASYDEMKLMVAELQRQLDEVMRIEKEVQMSLQNRTRAGSLPMNRSDSCLCNHSESSSKAQRFNPFNRTLDQHANCANMNNHTESSKMSNAVSENDMLRHNDQTVRASRQKYIFIEMHEYYGQMFRRVFEDIRKSKNVNSNDQLIDLN